MRMMVFFDLPVTTSIQRRQATQFRNFLLKDGYFMVQFSVYARICSGYDDVQKHKIRLDSHIPPSGSVRLLTITQKQYESMDILVGKTMFEDTPQAEEPLMIL